MCTVLRCFMEGSGASVEFGIRRGPGTKPLGSEGQLRGHCSHRLPLSRVRIPDRICEEAFLFWLIKSLSFSLICRETTYYFNRRRGWWWRACCASCGAAPHQNQS